jgi:hypothetical protein
VITPPNQGAPANRRSAGQSHGSDNLSAIVAADRGPPAAVAELGRWLDSCAMNEEPFPRPLLLLVGILTIALFVTIFRWFFRRSGSILESWANQNGFEMLEKHARYPPFFAGPFKFWTTSRNQVVYRFKVRDAAGNDQSGWARCGSFWGGVFFSDKIEIRWDETKSPS